MRPRIIRRSVLAGFAAAALVVLTPGVAAAAPPAGDDFDDAVPVTALPFTHTVDTEEATVAPDDPPDCYAYSSRSVWFSYTAQTDGYVMATPVATFGTVLSAYTGARGALEPVPGMCSFYSGIGETFHVTAGTTYHLLVASQYGYGGELTLRVTETAPSPNDDVADAEPVPGLPTSTTGDLTRASAEADEVPPSCDPLATQSVWYSYTPSTARWVSAQATGGPPAVSVHRATDMSEVDCAADSGYAVFRAEVGETYYVRVATSVADADRYNVHFRTAPALHPSVSGYPDPATVFRPVTLSPWSGDQLNQPVTAAHLDFGDGTSTDLTGLEPVEHQYTVDGARTLTLTVTTEDGRTATGTSTLRVESHDVGITTFTAPATARPDRPKPLSVTVTNTRYAETVTVELRRQTADWYETVGRLTQTVPAGGTVTFPFAYTFGAEDVGPVTFTAVTLLDYPSTDDNPGNDTASAITTVRP